MWRERKNSEKQKEVTENLKSVENLKENEEKT
jgi:hypothetical protein